MSIQYGEISNIFIGYNPLDFSEFGVFFVLQFEDKQHQDFFGFPTKASVHRGRTAEMQRTWERIINLCNMGGVARFDHLLGSTVKATFNNKGVFEGWEVTHPTNTGVEEQE